MISQIRLFVNSNAHKTSQGTEVLSSVPYLYDEIVKMFRKGKLFLKTRIIFFPFFFEQGAAKKNQKTAKKILLVATSNLGLCPKPPRPF